jgi:CheY-like chemotaxis protein
MGFQVMLITNGLEVMPYLQKNAVNVIILDLELPGMNGDQIFRKIKDDKVLEQIPIIPFTAHHNKSDEPLTNSFVLTAYSKTRVIPEIVYKTSSNGDVIDLNAMLIEEVAYALVNAGQELTSEMIRWYRENNRKRPVRFEKR